MKAVVQRVKSANVSIDGQIVGKISQGLLVLLGVCQNDNDEVLDWMSNKIAGLRIFSDKDRKMNLSVIDVKGQILIISNFTVCGDARKGFRPSFTNAATPEHGELYYERMISRFIDMGIHTESGRFGAMMDVELINDGPVTIIVEKNGAEK